jgi:hypothetical protein
MFAMLTNIRDIKIELINFKLCHKILFIYLQLSLLTPQKLMYSNLSNKQSGQLWSMHRD